MSAPKRCNFRGRSAADVRLLLVGRIKGSAICDVCILKAMHGLIDKLTSPQCADAVIAVHQGAA